MYDTRGRRKCGYEHRMFYVECFFMMYLFLLAPLVGHFLFPPVAIQQICICLIRFQVLLRANPARGPLRRPVPGLVGGALLRFPGTLLALVVHLFR